jgi:hypothetical protein
LGKDDVVLNVTGAHTYAFANGALAFLFQQTKYLEPRWIGYSLKRRDELFIRESHIEDSQYTEVIVN